MNRRKLKKGYGRKLKKGQVLEHSPMVRKWFKSWGYKPNLSGTNKRYRQNVVIGGVPYILYGVLPVSGPMAIDWQASAPTTFTMHEEHRVSKELDPLVFFVPDLGVPADTKPGVTSHGLNFPGDV